MPLEVPSTLSLIPLYASSPSHAGALASRSVRLASPVSFHRTLAACTTALVKARHAFGSVTCWARAYVVRVVSVAG